MNDINELILGKGTPKLEEMLGEIEVGMLLADRYTVMGLAGQGTWGKVFLVRDERIRAIDPDAKMTLRAAKFIQPDEEGIQHMKGRGVSYVDAVLKEARQVENCPNLVSRDLEFHDGVPFVVMPYYERTLADLLEKPVMMRASDRKELMEVGWGRIEVSFPSGMYCEYSLLVLEDMAKGLKQFHDLEERENVWGRTTGLVFGDLKPENVLIDRHGNALLSDFGTTTLATLTVGEFSKEKIGHIYIRAPEVVDDTATTRSDIWSFGSLMYKMIMGEFILEKELNLAPDSDGIQKKDEYFRNLTERGYTLMLKEKLAEVPKRFKKLVPFMRTCLEYKPSERYRNGEMLLDAFYQTLGRIESQRQVRRTKDWLWKTGGVIGIGLGIGIPMLIWGGPFEVNPVIHDKKPYKVADLDGLFTEGERLEFRRPDIPQVDIQEVHEHLYIDRFKKLAHTLDAAYIVDEYYRTAIELGMDEDCPAYGEDMDLRFYANTECYRNFAQTQIFESYARFAGTTDPNLQRDIWGSANEGRHGDSVVVLHAIEYGIAEARDEEGIVDLGAACTIGRLGLSRYTDLVVATKSDQFMDYIHAQDSQGNDMVNPRDRAFLMHWMGRLENLRYL
jgi:serine/threonine protein kinase